MAVLLLLEAALSVFSGDHIIEIGFSLLLGRLFLFLEIGCWINLPFLASQQF